MPDAISNTSPPVYLHRIEAIDIGTSLQLKDGLCRDINYKVSTLEGVEIIAKIPAFFNYREAGSMIEVKILKDLYTI